MFHLFSSDISSVALPELFNNPFHYRPHALCTMAADEVRSYLSTQETMSAEVAKGKMFGVLVVKDALGRVGYLAAFSGLLAGTNMLPFFVPPVYNMLAPEGYFKCEESNISRINEEIAAILVSNEYLNAKKAYDNAVASSEKAIQAMRESMSYSKHIRDTKRSTMQLTADEEAVLIAESQYQKAEFKRLQKTCRQAVTELQDVLSCFTNKIDAMKEKRKQRSAALQEWLFNKFIVYNANGESRSLYDIFIEYRATVPPAGAGECAAPKLLQYAYLNNLTPISMAEFWLGESPAGEVRRDGCYYGSCKGKCEPILSFMLQGLNVEKSSLEDSAADKIKIDILYEDSRLLVVNKPKGVLSVPGKVGGKSLQELLCERLNNGSLKVVHRLDMATSGLLVVAKDNDAYKSMQALFATRKVNKIYYALLDGVPAASCGEISLPLSPDYINRPRQMVNLESGSSAVTHYRILSVGRYKGRDCAVAELKPVTGRTHQLRVHCAHKLGLDTPIVGDELYGVPGECLMLHSSHVSFVSPFTGKLLSFDSPAEFIGYSQR